MTNFLGANFSTAILQYPSKRYGLVGSVPVVLCKENGNSMSWETEQEAIDALLSIGITKFQKANCEWYEAENA